MISKYRGGDNRSRSSNAVAVNNKRGQRQHGGGMVDMHQEMVQHRNNMMAEMNNMMQGFGGGRDPFANDPFF